MDKNQFIDVVNRKYAVQGLPGLDLRDLPKLAEFTANNKFRSSTSEFTERNADNPMIKQFLTKKQEKIQDWQKERTCLSCKEKFTPANNVELYLYCDLRSPPPEDYCPGCLNKITQHLESREFAENFRC